MAWYSRFISFFQQFRSGYSPVEATLLEGSTPMALDAVFYFSEPVTLSWHVIWRNTPPVEKNEDGLWAY
jgi:hypothetical protein